MGRRCLLVIFVSGNSLLPVPPAKIIPFIETLIVTGYPSVQLCIPPGGSAPLSRASGVTRGPALQPWDRRGPSFYGQPDAGSAAQLLLRSLSGRRTRRVRSCSVHI